MFSIVADELLADLTRIPAVSRVIVGFSAGVAVMLGIRRLTRRLEGVARPAGGAGPTATSSGVASPKVASPGVAEPRPGARVSLALLVTVAIDIVVDGLRVETGFAAGGGPGGCSPSP